MSKKSLFEKLGLVESEVPEVQEFETEDVVVSPELDVVEEPVSAIAGSEDLMTVEEVYSLNGIEDLENTVYKIQEMINALPSEMPDSTKKVTIRGMMSVVGLSHDEIVKDSEHRFKVLDSAFSSKISELKTEWGNNTAKIEEMKQAIERLEIRNNKIEESINSNLDVLHKEAKKIETIIDFIEVEGGNEQ